jgi:SCY1-like protein 2
VLSPTQFAALVLPNLKPLFAIKDPPQNMLTLLNNVNILQEKTEKPVFLERAYFCTDFDIRVEVFLDVMPLVYNAMESEHTVVSLAKVLKISPE